MSNANNASLKSLFYGSSNSSRKHQNDIAPSAECSDVQQQRDLLQVKTNARHCNEMKMYFLDHYLEFLTYLDARKKRTDKVKGQVSQLDNEIEKQMVWKEHCSQERVALRKRRARIRPGHFLTIKQIGQGGYGQVFLARKRDTLELCALKKMSKKLLCKLGETQHILTERDILTRTDSPWLVKLLYAFQDFDHVYLVMEYVPGGDLRTLLNASGILHDHHAKFYFGEMCASVFELHKLGFLHRDLKPENFLLDATGHIKLTDFGLSRGKLSHDVVDLLKKKLEIIKSGDLSLQTVNQRFNTYQTMRKDTRAFSIVGSPDYMAVEILTSDGEGYNHSVDYWSLGCILFEIVCGYPPFTAPTTDKVWVNLYNWKTVLERPVYEGEDAEFNLSDECWDLIRRLIADPKDRFSNPEQVKRHPYLSEINLEIMRSPGAYNVPLIPKLQSELDTAYFDDFSNPQDMALYADIKRKESDNRKRGEMMDIQVPHSAFVGFTFKRKE